MNCFFWQQETNCSTFIYLTFNVEKYKNVNAGSDQTKCPQEGIFLNGNAPFKYAIGTWTRLYCSNLDYYTVIIEDDHDNQTPIFVYPQTYSICPPDTLCFVWSFTSDRGDCQLSDTTRVIIRDSCCFLPPCPQALNVKSECINDSIKLTLLNGLDQIVSPSQYDIHWEPVNVDGNPITLAYSSAFDYSVEVTKATGTDTICHSILSGTTVACPPVVCGAKVVESCAASGETIVTLIDNLTGLPITPGIGDHEITWTVFSDSSNNAGDIISMVNPITIHNGACYSLDYVHFEYPPNVPHLIQYHTGICNYNLPRTCESIDCQGPCTEFNQFMVAGCGDILDIGLDLLFPEFCKTVCSPNSTYGTLGLFYNYPPYAPVSPDDYFITWKNGSTDAFVTGDLYLINEVQVMSKEDTCVWTSSYSAECPCDNEPTSVLCEQPITKYCRPDGTFYYQMGLPQIAWQGVPGATGYILEITTAPVDGCCTLNYDTYQLPPVETTVWTIPSNLLCFSVRVRAIMPYCEGETAWSEPYYYCQSEAVCEQVLTICGCCHGARDGSEAGLRTRMVSEDQLLAYMNSSQGGIFATLKEALAASGSVESLGFKVFPNPTTDQITIQNGLELKGNYTAELTDLLHRKWKNIDFDTPGQHTLDVRGFPAGIYLLTIKNSRGEQVFTEKITVLR